MLLKARTVPGAGRAYILRKRAAEGVPEGGSALKCSGTVAASMQNVPASWRS